MNRKNFLLQAAIGTGSLLAAPYILTGQPPPAKIATGWRGGNRIISIFAKQKVKRDKNRFVT